MVTHTSGNVWNVILDTSGLIHLVLMKSIMVLATIARLPCLIVQTVLLKVDVETVKEIIL